MRVLSSGHCNVIVLCHPSNGWQANNRMFDISSDLISGVLYASFMIRIYKIVGLVCLTSPNPPPRHPSQSRQSQSQYHNVS
jgi:hypothetical protein